MDIKEGDNRFYIGESYKDPLAEIVFSYKKSDIMVIERTFVSEELRGQSIAAKLLEKAVSKARAEGSKIIPECSYAQKVMSRGEEYQEVLFKENGQK
jgi:predicted GNAT family acetyltransferase